MTAVPLTFSTPYAFLGELGADGTDWLRQWRNNQRRAAAEKAETLLRAEGKPIPADLATFLRNARATAPATPPATTPAVQAAVAAATGTPVQPAPRVADSADWLRQWRNNGRLAAAERAETLLRAEGKPIPADLATFLRTARAPQPPPVVATITPATTPTAAPTVTIATAAPAVAPAPTNIPKKASASDWYRQWRNNGRETARQKALALYAAEGITPPADLVAGNNPGSIPRGTTLATDAELQTLRAQAATVAENNKRFQDVNLELRRQIAEANARVIAQASAVPADALSPMPMTPPASTDAPGGIAPPLVNLPTESPFLPLATNQDQASAQGATPAAGAGFPAPLVLAGVAVLFLMFGRKGKKKGGGK